MAEFDCGDVQRNSEDVDQDKSGGAKPKVYRDGQYSDPVYKKLSKINGEINQLTKREMQDRLREFGLDTRGLKDVLKKRLKNHYKKKKLSKAKVKSQNGKTPFDYIAVIDFEATCEDNNLHYRHEIIEFPVVLIDVDRMEIVDKFHKYVRPLVNPKLTTFCTRLTGITQAQVDTSDVFPEVLSQAETWFQTHGMNGEKTFAILTDGPWDMFRFMYYQCKESGVDMPDWSKKWINIRKSYCNFYNCQRGGIEAMLKNLGMRFEGSPHSGIDDAVNIARIAIKLLNDGCCLNLNERISVKQNPHDSKVEVRYERYEPKVRYCVDSDDEDQNEEKRPKSRKGQRRDIEAKGEIVEKLGALSLNNCDGDLEGEGIEDLMTYYNLQNS